MTREWTKITILPPESGNIEVVDQGVDKNRGIAPQAGWEQKNFTKGGLKQKSKTGQIPLMLSTNDSCRFVPRAKREAWGTKVTQLQKLTIWMVKWTKNRVVSGKADTTPKVDHSDGEVDKKSSCVRKS